MHTPPPVRLVSTEGVAEGEISNLYSVSHSNSRESAVRFCVFNREVSSGEGRKGE